MFKRFPTIRLKALLCAIVILSVVSVAAAQTNPPAYNGSASYATGDIVTWNGNYYRAIAATRGNSPITYQYWELHEVHYPVYNPASPSATTYNLGVGVGQPFPNLAIAWNFIKNAVIAQSSQVQLNIRTTNGALNENFTQPLNLDQPFGANISIVGDNSSNINLEFVEPTVNSAPPINGIVLDTGHSLKSLQNVTVSAVNDASDDYGLFVDTSASLNVANVTVDNFDVGAQVQHGGHLYCTSSSNSQNSLTVASFGLAAIFAQDFAFISCRKIIVNGKLTGTVTSTNGIVADNHSEIYAYGAQVSNLTNNGVWAQHNSTISAEDSMCTNAVTCYVASDRGYIDAATATASGWGNYGFYAAAGGTITANQGATGLAGTDSNTGAYVITH